MKHICSLLIIMILLGCKENQGKKDTVAMEKKVVDSSKKKSNRSIKQNSKKKPFQGPEISKTAYVTAKNGLNYRKSKNLEAEVLGEFDFGTKVDIVDNRSGTYFFVEDKERGSLHGKWVGVRHGSSTVYVFDGYLYPITDNEKNHFKMVDGELEVIFTEVMAIETGLKLVIEKHLQTSNHLADYTNVKLVRNNDTVFTHRINYLFKDWYRLNGIEGKDLTYQYYTEFDECPAATYKQIFQIKDDNITILNEYYTEAEEAEEVEIDWNDIPIQNLPFSSKQLAKLIESENNILQKYCCHPRCDKEFTVSEIDRLFSNKTKDKNLKKFEGNSHPSEKQAYFLMRLPDLQDNKVVLFSYYDGEASDYKTCTIEIQIFDAGNELLDKKIIEDGITYECGWNRSFEISKGYILTLTDSSFCYDLESKEPFDIKSETFKFRISPQGKIENNYN